MKWPGRMLLLAIWRYQIRSEFLSVLMSCRLLLDLIMSLIRLMRSESWRVLNMLLLVVIRLIAHFLMVMRPLGRALNRSSMYGPIRRIFGRITGWNWRFSAICRRFHLFLIGSTAVGGHSRFRTISRDFAIVQVFAALSRLNDSRWRSYFAPRLVDRLQLVRFRLGTILLLSGSVSGWVNRFSGWR